LQYLWKKIRLKFKFFHLLVTNVTVDVIGWKNSSNMSAKKKKIKIVYRKTAVLSPNCRRYYSKLNACNVQFSWKILLMLSSSASTSYINTSSENNVHFNNNNENSVVFNNNLSHLNNLLLNDNSTQNYNFNDSAVDIIDSTCSITECVIER